MDDNKMWNIYANEEKNYGQMFDRILALKLRWILKLMIKLKFSGSKLKIIIIFVPPIPGNVFKYLNPFREFYSFHQK